MGIVIPRVSLAYRGKLVVTAAQSRSGETVQRRIGEEEGEEGKRRGGRVEVTRRGQECRRQPAGYTIRRTNGAFENKISALRAATFE